MTTSPTTLTVEIDVADDEHLTAEAAASGCVAIPTDKGYRPPGTYLYGITGPTEAVLALLSTWGYEEGGYLVKTDREYCISPTSDHKHSESWYDCEPCELCGDDSVPEICDCGKPGHAADSLRARLARALADYDTTISTPGQAVDIAETDLIAELRTIVATAGAK